MTTCLLVNDKKNIMSIRDTIHTYIFCCTKKINKEIERRIEFLQKKNGTPMQACQKNLN